MSLALERIEQQLLQLRAEMATKQDLAQLRTELKADMVRLGTQLRAEFNADMPQYVNSALEAHQYAVNAVDDKYTDLPSRVAALEQRVAGRKRR